MIMSFIRYYLFWPMYIALWVGRYSSTTRGRDEGSNRQKTLVEHELDRKYWQARHFWAPLMGLFLYSFAWIFFVLVIIPLLNNEFYTGGLSPVTILQLLWSYIFFFFIFSPTSILLTLIYWYIFVSPDDFATLAPTMGTDWLLGSLLSIYTPIIELGLPGLLT